MKRLCVFCGSKSGRRSVFKDSAALLGSELARRGIGLVYGGASVGLMGAMADSALESGGEVIGVIPRALADIEIAHHDVTELLIVETMHERKAKMAELSDGFIALPGGLGTLEELFEVVTWRQLGLHEKPCGLLNVDGYFDHLLAFLRLGASEGFVTKEYQHLIRTASQPAALLDVMQDAASAKKSDSHPQ